MEAAGAFMDTTPSLELFQQTSLGVEVGLGGGAVVVRTISVRPNSNSAKFHASVAAT